MVMSQCMHEEEGDAGFMQEGMQQENRMQEDDRMQEDERRPCYETGASASDEAKARASHAGGGMRRQG